MNAEAETKPCRGDTRFRTDLLLPSLRRCFSEPRNLFRGGLKSDKRPQRMGQRTYSGRQEDGTVLAWEVERLWEITRDFPSKQVPLNESSDFELVTWFDDKQHLPTCRAVAEHARKIMVAKFDYPVILSAEGHVMDGMHRVAKAWLLGLEAVEAVQFDVDPEPDERVKVES